MKLLLLLLFIPIFSFCQAKKSTALKEIERDEDKFTGKVSLYTPDYDGVSFIKTIFKTDTTLYISIVSVAPTLNLYKKGLKILLANKEQIQKPDVDIDVKPSRYGYTYTAMFPLNNDDIKLLLSSEITDTRLFINDRSVVDGALIQEYLRRILK